MNATLESRLAELAAREGELCALHGDASREASRLDGLVASGDFSQTGAAAAKNAERDAISRALEAVQRDMADTRVHIVQRDATAARALEIERLQGVAREILELEEAARCLAMDTAAALSQAALAIIEKQIGATRLKSELTQAGSRDPALLREVLTDIAPGRLDCRKEADLLPTQNGPKPTLSEFGRAGVFHTLAEHKSEIARLRHKK